MRGRTREDGAYMEAETLVIWAATEVDHQTGDYESGDQSHCKPSRNQTTAVSILGAY